MKRFNFDDAKTSAIGESRRSPSPETSMPLQSQDEMYVLYTIKTLFKGQSAVMYRNIFSINSSDLHPHRPIMNTCLLVLATTFYGIQNHESKVLLDGMNRYGRGLNMLHSALKKEACKVTTELLVAVFALSMVEVSESLL